jgi:hypothetical protein
LITLGLVVVLRLQVNALVDELLAHLDERQEPTGEPKGRRTL